MIQEADPPHIQERQLTVTRYLRASTRAAEQMALIFDLDALLARVAAILVDDFDAALARVWLYAPESRTLQLKASAGTSSPTLDAAYAQIKVAAYPYPVGEAARALKPVVQNGLNGDVRCPDPEWARDSGVVSLAVFPLIIGRTLRGVLACFSRRTLFDEVVEALANFAAIVTAAVSDIDQLERERAAREEMEQKEQALRHRAAELARMARALERTNKELDQFAYITSHDLKAPLRGIANLSRWIEEDLGDDLQEETRKQLELLRGRVNRMEAMIEGILQYSRVGRVAITPQRVDVNALLAEVIDLLAPPENVHIEIGPNMPVLKTQRLPLQQVFQNLIGNAIKHNRRSDPRVEITVQDVGDDYAFTVRDNGPGIAPEYQEKIFLIFQTLEARDKVENTGVGLSLIKKIVENLGGSISVQSQEGAGAAFHFTWPKGE